MNCVKDYILYIYISVCRFVYVEKRIEIVLSKGYIWICIVGLFIRLNIGNI